jgi:hypothetical protein
MKGEETSSRGLANIIKKIFGVKNRRKRSKLLKFTMAYRSTCYLFFKMIYQFANTAEKRSWIQRKGLNIKRRRRKHEY